MNCFRRWINRRLSPLRTRLGLLLLLLLGLAVAPLTGCRTTPSAATPRTDPGLQARLEQLVQGFEGDVGIYVRHVPSGRAAAIRADELFSTASMIKVPILCGVFDHIEHGQLQYDQELTYRESLKYDNGITGSFRDGAKISIAKLAHLMISLSDNTASLWLQDVVGGTNINAWLEQNGFSQTRVNSRVPGREEARKEFGWGQTTPREMAELVAGIAEQRFISPAASVEMYRVLAKPYWDQEALSQLPLSVHVAAKSGAVNASKSEVVYVNAPSGDYVFCLITKNQKDQRWTEDNAGYVIARRLSRLLWEHFEPGSKWTPPLDAGKWRK